METIFLTPAWFFFYEIGFDAISAIIAILVSFYAYKIFQLTDRRQLKFFSLGFFLISCSYAVQLLVNLAVFFGLSRYLCCEPQEYYFNLINTLGVDVYVALFIGGLVTLVYMTLNVNMPRLYGLLLLLSGLSIILSINRAHQFYLLSSILLLYIITYYFSNYIAHRKLRSLVTLVAFSFFLLGSVHFLLSVNHVFFYVLGNLLELVGMMLILANLIMILRR